MSDVKTASKADDNAKSGASGASSAASAGQSKLPGPSDFNINGGPGKEPSKDAGAATQDGGANAEDRERNAVFGNLVTGDEDIVGLVAYSIYKQNKHDWLVSFGKAKGREPSEGEAYSYIIGESTARRLAIYRHLAQATLDGNGPHVSGGPAKEKFVQHSLSNANSLKSGSGAGGGKGLFWIVGLIAVVAALYIGAKFGMPGLPR